MSKEYSAESQPPDADALFLGDICFGSSYGRTSFKKRGFDSSFEHVDELLQRAGFVIANLETVLTTHKTSLLDGKKRYIHKDDPEAAAALRRHGIDLVSLANNHAFDYGTPGLVETLESLREADITVLTLHRDTTVTPNPRDGRLLEVGDRLLCFGRLENMRNLVPARRRRRARPKMQPLPDEPTDDTQGSTS